MPFYLTRFRYTPETWARLVKHPEDRRAAAVSMAATAIALSAGGALASCHTTVLMTVEETIAALQKSASIRYQPPGA
jgi:predicted N-acyltransferase